MNIMKTKLLFAMLVLVMSCAPMDSNDRLVSALNDESIPIRGDVIEIPGEGFRYDYYDVMEKDSHYKKLESRGYQGGGYSWAGIIYGAMLKSDPRLLGMIRFDEEGEGLVIWSQSKPALQQIGRLVAVVKSDDKILDECIAAAESRFKME